MVKSGSVWSVTVATSIADVDQLEWNSLAKSNVVSSHGWLQAFEEDSLGRFDPYYVLLRLGGELVGATSCFLCHPGCRLFNPDEFMYGRFGRLPELLHLSFYPAMVVGPHGPYGYHRTFLVAEDLDASGRHRAHRMLLSKVEELAQSAKAPIHFPYLLTDKESEVTQLLGDRDYLVTRAFPICYLDVEWDSFDGYLSYLTSFSTKMRRNVKEEMNRFRRAGFTVEVIEDPAAYRDRLFELADAHYRSYNNRGVAFKPEFLPKLKQLLGREATFYGAFRDGCLVGFVVLVRRGDVGYLPWTGIDRDTTAREGTYFNLVFYRPIEDAIGAKIKRLYFGRALYGTKLRRGCRIYGPHHLYRASSRVSRLVSRPWFVFHDHWMRRKMGEIEDLERLRRLKPE